MRKKLIAQVVIYSVALLSTIATVLKGVLYQAGEGQVGDSMSGLGYFKAFTPDSNILYGIFALFALIFIIKNKNCEFPKWLRIFDLVGTTAVCVTFITVVFFLTPLFISGGSDWTTLFTRDMFHLHVLNPILAAVAYIFTEKSETKGFAKYAFALLPVLIYSIIYALCVIVFKCWTDFYGFTFGGKLFMVPVALLGMYGLSLGLTWLLNFLNKKRRIL